MAYNIFDDESKTLEEKNDAYSRIREQEVVRLRSFYDFSTVNGIRNIPVPCTEVNGDSPTGRVEYYLRGQCFAKYYKEKNIALGVECVRKAHSLMFISDMIWKYDAYISDITHLHNLGAHKQAWEEEARVDSYFQKVGIYPHLSIRDFPNVFAYFKWKRLINEMEEERIRKRSIRHEYYRLQEYLPALCPKSLSGYSRMKNSNSKAYQKILAQAALYGVDII